MIPRFQGLALAWLLAARSLVWTLTVLALVLLSCQGNVESLGQTRGTPEGTTSQQDKPPAIPMVNKIAYVGSSGDLFTIDPDGGNRFNLTGGTRVGAAPQGGVLARSVDTNNVYFWPTWSPDGALLAASRVTTTGGLPEVSVEVFDIVNGGVKTVYKNEMPSMIAEGAPHYLYWSPDSRSLALLVSSPEAFALVVADVRDIGGGELRDPDLIETGAPLYFHWGAGGNEILLHARNDLKLAAKPFESGLSTLLTVGQGFRTAALSPDSGRIAYTATNENGSGSSLFVAETGAPGSGTAILEVGPSTAFAWSPDGAELAVAEGGGPDGPGFRRLLVVPAQGGPARTLAEEAVIAFFWSPKGDSIAWVSADPQDLLLEWKVSPVNDFTPNLLFRFRPTVDVLTMLSFFDQYAYSHSPWSPDGAWLVVAGIREEPFAQRNGGSPRRERIFVLDANGTTEPRELAEGSLGVWSWN